MENKSVLDMVDRPIAFQRVFVDLVGSVVGALFLSQAVYWQKRVPRGDGWWWKTAAEWEEETGMKRYELEQAKKACSKFLQIKKQGVPCKTFYRVDISSLQSSLSAFCKLDCRPSANKSVGPLQTITETTAETTAETTEDFPAVAAPLEVKNAAVGEPPKEKTEHAKFTAGWNDAHLEAFGEKYFYAGRDFRPLATLLETSKLTAAELLDIAKLAWSLPVKQWSWERKQSQTISSFCSCFPQITAALRESGKRCPKKESPKGVW